MTRLVNMSFDAWSQRLTSVKCDSRYDKAVCWGYLRLCSRVSGAACDKAVCWGYLRWVQ